jgi:hypothetical protein
MLDFDRCSLDPVGCCLNCRFLHSTEIFAGCISSISLPCPLRDDIATNLQDLFRHLLRVCLIQESEAGEGLQFREMQTGVFHGQF